MEQFSLEKYLANPSRKVVTRDGRPVRIICTDRKARHDSSCNLQDYLWLVDWLNKNHFDYRGLIEKGLAIDATGLNIY